MQLQICTDWHWIAMKIFWTQEGLKWMRLVIAPNPSRVQIPTAHCLFSSRFLIPVWKRIPAWITDELLKTDLERPSQKIFRSMFALNSELFETLNIFAGFFRGHWTFRRWPWCTRTLVMATTKGRRLFQEPCCAWGLEKLKGDDFAKLMLDQKNM